MPEDTATTLVTVWPHHAIQFSTVMADSDESCSCLLLLQLFPKKQANWWTNEHAVG